MTASDQPAPRWSAVPDEARYTFHAVIISLPVTCFIGALLTDLMYYASAEMMWANFSAWLLTAGLVLGILGAFASSIRFLRYRSVRSQGSGLHAIGIVLLLLVALFNVLVHTRDAWTSVVPIGLVLSVLTVLILPVTGWLGWSVGYRRKRIGVAQ